MSAEPAVTVGEESIKTGTHKNITSKSASRILHTSCRIRKHSMIFLSLKERIVKIKLIAAHDLALL